MIGALDPFTVMAVTALVVDVSAALFIVETLVRRDEGAGRLWSLAFLAAMLTTLSYVVWARSPEAAWAVAVGNAAFVGGTGCMWLGCRRFNGRRVAWGAALVLAAAAATAVAAVLDPQVGGGWGGALVMFLALTLMASLGLCECVRGRLGRARTGWALAGVFAFQALFFLLRAVVFTVAGPDSAVFQDWFGTVPAALMTAALTIVTVVTASLLRATSDARRSRLGVALETASGDISGRAAFAGELARLSARAGARSELVAVIAVRIDDLEQISTAFGSGAARTVTDIWRTGVRRHAPSDALVAEDGPEGLLVAMLADSPNEARRCAGRIHRGLFDDFGTIGAPADNPSVRANAGFATVIPVVGVGVALSDECGYSATELIRRARAAAKTAAATVDISVLIGDVR